MQFVWYPISFVYTLPPRGKWLSTSYRQDHYKYPKEVTKEMQSKMGQTTTNTVMGLHNNSEVFLPIEIIVPTSRTWVVKLGMNGKLLGKNYTPVDEKM